MNSQPTLDSYPRWICMECGRKHGRRLPDLATWHQGKCDLCQQAARVTEPRDFGHLRTNWKKRNDT